MRMGGYEDGGALPLLVLAVLLLQAADMPLHTLNFIVLFRGSTRNVDARLRFLLSRVMRESAAQGQ